MDHALVNFIVEVLAFDIDLLNSSNAAVEPECEGICFIGGRKDYNEY